MRRNLDGEKEGIISRNHWASVGFLTRVASRSKYLPRALIGRNEVWTMHGGGTVLYGVGALARCGWGWGMITSSITAQCYPPRIIHNASYIPWTRDLFTFLPDRKSENFTFKETMVLATMVLCGNFHTIRFLDSALRIFVRIAIVAIWDT